MNQESHLYNCSKFDRFIVWCSLHRSYVLPLVFFIALFIHSDLAPLEETHWDAPIYVQLSKRAAETNMLADYHQHARDVQLGPGDAAHWYFTRIGHILLLGEVARLFGTTETALVAMQWLYRIFMALGVSLCIVLGFRLVALFRSERTNTIWWAGYLIASTTYLFSDSYRGLQGHLISEPPAFLILTSFAILLIRAVERRSLVTGTFAGCLLFLLFFIRIDAVLPGIFFLIVLFTTMVMSRKFDVVLPIAVAGFASLSLYLVYAWLFYPLVNPQTLMDFSSLAKKMFPGVPVRSLFAILIAGGLLWIGASVAILKLWRDPLVRFVMLWLGLALLPMVIDSLNGRSVQARMVFFAALPLLVLAGEGWSLVLERFIKERKTRPLTIALSLVAIFAFTPHSLIIQEFRSLAVNYLPSGIQKYLFISLAKRGEIGPAPQNQDTRLGLLVRPMYERWTLDYSKAREIGEFLYGPERPVYLLWSRARLDDQQQLSHSLEGYIGLFRYFGKRYPENANIVLARLPNNVGPEPCTSLTPTALEPVVFCSALNSSEWKILLGNKIPLFILSAEGYPMPNMPPLKLKVLLFTPPFVLYGIAE